MFWFAYNFLFHIAYLLLLPHFLLRMRRRGGYRHGFGERIFHLSPEKAAVLQQGSWFWVHAVSVGEVNVALSWMRAWRESHPGTRFLLTVNTSTGQAIARAHLHPDDLLLYPPVDSPPVLRRLFTRVRIQAVLLVETEVWPNLLRQATRRHLPVFLYNGRVSDRSFRRLRRIPWLTRRIYPLLDLCLMQSADDAERIAHLGARSDRIRTLPTSKYDVDPPVEAEIARRRQQLQDCGWLPARSLVLLGASTWPGEEAALAGIAADLRRGCPGLRLILVPRHAERAAEVTAELAAAGHSVARWSQPGSVTAAAEILLVDTTGELRHFTGLADWVFVGKSLFRPEGQNPLEAAVAGKTIFTGSGMRNFHEVMEDLRGADAVREVADPDALKAVFELALQDPAAAAAMGTRARALVETRRGGVALAVAAVAAQLSGNPP